MKRIKSELSRFGISMKDLDRIAPQAVIRGRIGAPKLIAQVVDYLKAGGSLDTPEGFAPSLPTREGRSTIMAYRCDIRDINQMSYDLGITIQELVERIADYLESGGDLTPPKKK